jgi:hypothetical protein
VDRPSHGEPEVTAWIIIAILSFAALSVLLTPAFGLGGLFYAWLGTNIAVVGLAFFLGLKEVP